MYYLDYAKKVGERYLLNFFADTTEDIADVPTDTPYITRNGTNYGVPLETSIVTVIENDVRKNYVLQNGAYIAGGDVPSVLGTLEATENKTYKASDEDLEGYSTVTVNVQPKLQAKTATENGEVTPDSGYDGLSKVTVNVPATAPKLQAKTATTNGVVKPDASYDGLSQVTVNVPATPTETKTVEPNFASGNQTLTPTEGKVFSSVTLTKPDTLLPENIKKGVIICGIEGTYEAAGA